MCVVACTELNQLQRQALSSTLQQLRSLSIACEAFNGADQQTSQMLAPGRFLELIRDRRDTAAAVEGNYRANERAERDQPKICFHIIYLKLSKTDMSDNFPTYSAMAGII